MASKDSQEQRVEKENRPEASPKLVWRIWTTIDKLLEQFEKHNQDQQRNCDDENTNNEVIDRSYLMLTDRVVIILRCWADRWNGQSEWANLLNKKTFQHEIEESMVALYYLEQWKIQYSKSNPNSAFVAVDVCGGKGIFSMLLQYYASFFWADKERNIAEDAHATLDRIILLDKATTDQINWQHLNASDATTSVQFNPPSVSIELWDDCSLYDYDHLYDRFIELDLPLAFTGIHLCRLLSPSLISLVNLLGRDKCPYTLLAPCCLPRMARTSSPNQQTWKKSWLPNVYRSLDILCHETQQERSNRIQRIEERNKMRRRKRNCYCCNSDDHLMYSCPSFQNISDIEKQQLLIESEKKTIPCWNCGLLGHFKAECPNANCRGDKFVPSYEPPMKQINVSNVLQQTNPMMSYCQSLATGFEFTIKQPQILSTGLKSHAKNQQEQQNNWNGHRKSIFIIVS